MKTPKPAGEINNHVKRNLSTHVRKCLCNSWCTMLKELSNGNINKRENNEGKMGHAQWSMDLVHTV